MYECRLVFNVHIKIGHFSGCVEKRNYLNLNFKFDSITVEVKKHIVVVMGG